MIARAVIRNLSRRGQANGCPRTARLRRELAHGKASPRKDKSFTEASSARYFLLSGVSAPEEATQKVFPKKCSAREAATPAFAKLSI
jgi:hypothetical protein